MNSVFADSFFFLALLNKRDARHAKASEFALSITHPIVTTQWVLVEVADAFCHPRNRGLFSELISYTDMDNRIEIVPANPPLFDRGAQLYLDRPDKAWSLTDCISFVVMQDRSITEALTGDHHFSQAGFVTLL